MRKQMRLVIKEANGNDILIDGIIDVWNIVPRFGFIEFDVLKTIHGIVSDVAKDTIADKLKWKALAVKLLRKLVNTLRDIHTWICLLNGRTSVRILRT